MTTAVQHRTGSSSQRSKEEKELKGIWIGKQEIKLSLFSDYMLFHMEIPRNVQNNSCSYLVSSV